MADGGRSLPDIARRIEALRNAFGMKGTEFAAAIGVTQPALSNYEAALRRPDIDVAFRIQARTGVTLDWLYSGDRSGLPRRLLEILPDLSEREKAG